MLWRRKSKRVSGEEPEPEHEAAKRTGEVPTQEEPVAAQREAAPIPQAPTAEEAPAPVAAAPSREETAREVQKAPEEPETPGVTTVFAAAPPPTAGPVRLVQEPSEPTEPGKVDEHPGVVEPDTAKRDAAATAGTVSAMHTIKPITSPRADSKLRNWFRDRLVRRSSSPVPVYPSQPGPDYNTESEAGFTGGAALTGANEPRGAALSSHPVTGADLEAGPSGRNGDVAQSSSEEYSQSRNGNGNGKRERLRKSFMKTISRSSPERTNGATQTRQESEAISESKETGTDVRGLRDSAAEQGLPAPPALRETVSAGRESRFSEDL